MIEISRGRTGEGRVYVRMYDQSNLFLIGAWKIQIEG